MNPSPKQASSKIFALWNELFWWINSTIWLSLKAARALNSKTNAFKFETRIALTFILLLHLLGSTRSWNTREYLPKSTILDMTSNIVINRRRCGVTGHVKRLRFTSCRVFIPSLCNLILAFCTLQKEPTCRNIWEINTSWIQPSYGHGWQSIQEV